MSLIDSYTYFLYRHVEWMALEKENKQLGLACLDNSPQLLLSTEYCLSLDSWYYAIVIDEQICSQEVYSVSSEMEIFLNS